MHGSSRRTHAISGGGRLGRTLRVLATVGLQQLWTHAWSRRDPEGLGHACSLTARTDAEVGEGVPGRGPLETRRAGGHARSLTARRDAKVGERFPGRGPGETCRAGGHARLLSARADAEVGEGVQNMAQGCDPGQVPGSPPSDAAGPSPIVPRYAGMSVAFIVPLSHLYFHCRIFTFQEQRQLLVAAQRSHGG